MLKAEATKKFHQNNPQKLFLQKGEAKVDGFQLQDTVLTFDTIYTNAPNSLHYYKGLFRNTTFS